MRKMRLHFKRDSGTLWHALFIALGVCHPRSVVYRAVERRQVRVMNSTPESLSGMGYRKVVPTWPQSRQSEPCREP